MITFSDYLKSHHHRREPFLIVGSASTLREDFPRIKKYIQDVRPIIIGINKMTHFLIPDYHLWTNKERYHNLGSCIHPSSTVLCGVGLPEELILQHYAGEYIQVDYERKAHPDSSMRCIGGRIYGFYRIAGCLAIMIAHLLNASSIHVVGFDGYTRFEPQEYEGENRKNQHCYGSGHTDDYSWEASVKKDNEIYRCLCNLRKFGVDFQIITDSIYLEVYDPTVLEAYNE